MSLHNAEKLYYDQGGGANKHLAFTMTLGIDDVILKIVYLRLAKINYM